MLAPLETVLRDMLAEHRALLAHLESQQRAMQQLDVKAVEAAAVALETCRRKILTLDARRRSVVRPFARVAAGAEPTLRQLIASHRSDLAPLAPLADELRAVAKACSDQAKIAARLAGGLLGHLNTAVRLMAGDGRYARDGSATLRKPGGRLRLVA